MSAPRRELRRRSVPNEIAHPAKAFLFSRGINRAQIELLDCPDRDKRMEVAKMHIAQIAPLAEAVPPKFYGGTERVIHWLTEELVALGHNVTLYASGDSVTSARLEAIWPRALRIDGSVRDANALHISMLEGVGQDANE